MKSADVAAIQRTAVPPASGSLSPPEQSADRYVSMTIKQQFAAKIREKFGSDPNITEVELVRKTELLWSGLSPQMKLLMLKSPPTEPQKENIASSLKKPVNQVKTTRKSSTSAAPRTISKAVLPPVLERRNNCKAIAKALDLKSDVKLPSTPRAVPYSQTVRNRMIDYRSDAQLLASRTTQSEQLDSRFSRSMPSSSNIPPLDGFFDGNFLSISNTVNSAPHRLSPPVCTSAPTPTPATSPVPNPTPIKSGPAVVPTTLKRPRQAASVRAPEKFARPAEKSSKLPEKGPKLPAKMTAEMASNMYYEMLSQSLLLYPGETDPIQRMGDLLSGTQVVCQYTSLEHL